MTDWPHDRLTHFDWPLFVQLLLPFLQKMADRSDTRTTAADDEAAVVRLSETLTNELEIHDANMTTLPFAQPFQTSALLQSTTMTIPHPLSPARENASYHMSDTRSETMFQSALSSHAKNTPPPTAAATPKPSPVRQNSVRLSSIYSAVNSAATQPAQKYSIYNRLIDDDTLSNDVSIGLPQKPSERVYTDPFFAYLYWTALIIMFVLGLVYLFTTTALSANVTWSLWYAYERSRGFIGTALLLSLGLGILWTFLLKHFVRPVIWLTVLLVPAAFFGVSVWSVQSLWLAPPSLADQAPWLITQSTISFLMGAASSIIIHKRRHNIKQSLDLIDLSFEILRDNPTIFSVSLLILVGYLIFALIWLALFGRLTLVGHIDETQQVIIGGHPLHTWIPDPFSPWLMAYFIGMFLWTSSLFSYLERTMISGVVAEWYFHRHNPVRRSGRKDPALDALKRACTFSFGTIVLAAFLLTFVHAIRLFSRLVRRVIARGSSSVSNSTPVQVFQSSLEYLEGLVEGLNAYALVYVAYSGAGFWEAAKNTMYLFRRNLIQALLLDNVTKILLLFGVYALAFVSCVATFNFALRQTTSSLPTVGDGDLDAPPDSHYAWLISLLGTILPFYMVRFFTFIITQVMDATYICYVIDLDTRQCHSVQAHQIFSSSSESRPERGGSFGGSVRLNEKPGAIRPAFDI